MKPALVSICIPTFNGSEFITEAMDSAISQSYPNLEIIVSDDDSDDNTLEIIETYKTQTEIPIYIYHHKPQGIGANWNHCIQKANGVYIKFLFQDDILLPNCIEEMVKVLEADQTIAIVASKREFIIEDSYLNEETKIWINSYRDNEANLDLPKENGLSILDKQIFRSKKFFESPRNKVGEPSNILFRKKTIKEIGYFREDLKQILDYEFYYRALKNNRIAILQNVLVKFRLHHNQTTNHNKGNDKEDYVIYDKIMYRQYFWYLNRDSQKYFFLKFNPIARISATIINRIKRVL